MANHQTHFPLNPTQFYIKKRFSYKSYVCEINIWIIESKADLFSRKDEVGAVQMETLAVIFGAY
jgi:hypothetical protein